MYEKDSPAQMVCAGPWIEVRSFIDNLLCHRVDGAEQFFRIERFDNPTGTARHATLLTFVLARLRGEHDDRQRAIFDRQLIGCIIKQRVLPCLYIIYR